MAAYHQLWNTRDKSHFIPSGAGFYFPARCSLFRLPDFGAFGVTILEINQLSVFTLGRMAYIYEYARFILPGTYTRTALGK